MFPGELKELVVKGPVLYNNNNNIRRDKTGINPIRCAF